MLTANQGDRERKREGEEIILSTNSKRENAVRWGGRHEGCREPMARKKSRNENRNTLQVSCDEGAVAGERTLDGRNVEN